MSRDFTREIRDAQDRLRAIVQDAIQETDRTGQTFTGSAEMDLRYALADLLTEWLIHARIGTWTELEDSVRHSLLSKSVWCLWRTQDVSGPTNAWMADFLRSPPARLRGEPGWSGWGRTRRTRCRAEGRKVQ